VIEDGYRNLAIYKLARSLATLIHAVTLTAAGWQPETAHSLRHSAKLIIQKIIVAFSQNDRAEFVKTLGEASALCSQIVSAMASPEVFSAVPKKERGDLLTFSRSLLESLHGSMGFRRDDPGSAFYAPDSPRDLSISEAHNRRRALEGKVILVTRPLHQSQQVVSMIEDSGGLPVVIPMIEIVEPDSWDPVDRSIVNLRGYDGVIFTSQNAVERFIARIDMVNEAAKKILSTRRIYAVGEKTAAALENAQIHGTLFPDHFSSLDLINALQHEFLAGRHFLFPKSNRAKEDVPEALRARDAVVDEIDVYKTVGPSQISAEPLVEAMRNGEIDAITFFSPSSVQYFSLLLTSVPMGKTVAACIGPSTTREASAFTVIVTAKEATIESLIEALIDYFERSQPLSLHEN
jgi:uroporphyrinogen-III synthase